MKLKATYIVEVDYFGIKLTVPACGYLATDRDGTVYWYSTEPAYLVGNGGWTLWHDQDASYLRVAELELDEDFNWCESLVEVEE